MSKKRKRISRRRLAGQRVLAHVPTFKLETGSHKPVTAARRYIAEELLEPPAILNVRRNEHTTDRFFWGEKGLFSAQYAEENHFLFPSLRTIVDRIGEEVLFEGIEAPRGEADDLKLISGIDAPVEQQLLALGVYHYWQSADLDDENLALLATALKMSPTDIVTADWINNAKKLVAANAA